MIFVWFYNLLWHIMAYLCYYIILFRNILSFIFFFHLSNSCQMLPNKTEKYPISVNLAGFFMHYKVLIRTNQKKLSCSDTKTKTAFFTFKKKRLLFENATFRKQQIWGVVFGHIFTQEPLTPLTISWTKPTVSPSHERIFIFFSQRKYK